MEIKEFIKERLQTMAKTFPNVAIRYAFDKIADVHIVELLPQTEYYKNEQLKNSWIDLSLEMIKEYPNDIITFISDDSTLKIENPEFEFYYQKEKEVAHEYVSIGFFADPFIETNAVYFSQSFSTHNMHLRTTRIATLCCWYPINVHNSIVGLQLDYPKNGKEKQDVICDDDCAIAA